MKQIDCYRQKIDEMDDEISNLLIKRWDLVKKIGLLKLMNKEPILALDREEQIKEKLAKKEYGNELIALYNEVFSISKKIQSPDFFLVGKKLDYSYSPIIYQMLGYNHYGLFETDHLDDVKKINFRAINVTNPFKHQAYLMCDSLTKEAMETKVVNLIVRENNQFQGYNTDCEGFFNTLDYFQIPVSHKKIIIIGNGATAKTIHYALLLRNASKIIHLVREIRKENEYLLSDYQMFLDFDIIINATPYGTITNNEHAPFFSLTEFHKLQTCIDVIYNPYLSPLLVEAKANHIPIVNGLFMLVSQAAKAYSIVFQNDCLDKIIPIYQKLKQDLRTIVLIGMPYSGKTTIGKKLALELQKSFIDVDEELTKVGLDLPSVLKKESLAYFREKEAECTISYQLMNNLVLSTGGGIVLQDNVMQQLKQNALVIFLNPSLDILISRIDQSRPLAANQHDLEKLYIERIALYHKYADIVINDLEMKHILEKINEYFSYQWS